MSVVSANSGTTAPVERRLRAVSLWREPLAPLAVAFTAGIVCDRLSLIPPAGMLLAAVIFLVAWGAVRKSRAPGLALWYLWAAVAGLGGMWHHWSRDGVAHDDIRFLAGDDPQVVHLRGHLAGEPVFSRAPSQETLRGYPRPQFTHTVFAVTHVLQHDQWQPVSGKARVSISGKLQAEIGSRVEIVGQLVRPPHPGNPGEFDYAGFLRDQGIGALVTTQETPAILAEASPWSLWAWRARIRAWGNDLLRQSLPAEEAALASALLLGDSGELGRDEWEKYVKTGVVHVLAISGQHLAVLAGFGWLILRVAGVRRRTGAIMIAVFLFSYAFVTGGRPPVMRAAWSVWAVCGSLFFLRPFMPINTFALAWLLVALANPTDIFTIGCQLSFLAVAVLWWWMKSSKTAEPDPMEALIDESRPAWLRTLRTCLGLLGAAYSLTVIVWLAVTPLAASRSHVVPAVAILLSPPMVVLTSIALIAGFLLFLFSAAFWPAAPLFAFFVRWPLRGCIWLVDGGLEAPAAYWYVPDAPMWSLLLFYLIVLGFLVCPGLCPSLWKKGLRHGLTALGLLWYAIGLGAGLLPRGESTELRCTFLAVGHGGCTVLEMPDGRVIVYDAGAIGGPEVTSRQIAPFLWSRGIRRIDEVHLSHADLDHFNGLPGLLDRFPIGRVICTPTFRERPTQAVAETLQALARHRVPVQIAKAGDRLADGPVVVDVLHPPAHGPEGNENARSLVLHVRHQGHALLLSGDLEGRGLERLLALPPPKVDVLMSPHHGSPTANVPELAKRIAPKVVVSCQGRPRGSARVHEIYEKINAKFLPTWAHGAVTFHSTADGLYAETYLSRRVWRIR